MQLIYSYSLWSFTISVLILWVKLHFFLLHLLMEGVKEFLKLFLLFNLFLFHSSKLTFGPVDHEAANNHLNDENANQTGSIPIQFNFETCLIFWWLCVFLCDQLCGVLFNLLFLLAGKLFRISVNNALEISGLVVCKFRSWSNITHTGQCGHDDD